MVSQESLLSIQYAMPAQYCLDLCLDFLWPTLYTLHISKQQTPFKPLHVIIPAKDGALSESDPDLFCCAETS